jgi:hypothetical protein
MKLYPDRRRNDRRKRDSGEYYAQGEAARRFPRPLLFALVLAIALLLIPLLREPPAGFHQEDVFRMSVE